MRTFKLLIVLFLLMPFLFATNSFSQSQVSQTISSSGLILTPPTSQKLLFQTDFSDITLGINANGRPSYFTYTDGSNFPFSSHINYQTSSARAEIVNDASATGGKALELEVYPGMPISDRCDANIYIQDLGITNELYVESRLKLREDYYLTSPGWHELVDLFSEWQGTGIPLDYMPLHVSGGPSQFYFTISLRYSPNDGTPNQIVWSRNSPVDLPRGEYFNLRYYVLRHPTNGKVKVWINDTLIFDVSGVETMLNEEFFTTPAKVYGGEVLPEKIAWCDSLEIYDGVPG